MTTLADIALKIRSKNAGPFWLTIDIFCDSEELFRRACALADTPQVAQALGCPVAQVKRFEIAKLNVLKFSVPRPHIQGTRFDRDMHGASFATLLAGLSDA